MSMNGEVSVSRTNFSGAQISQALQRDLFPQAILEHVMKFLMGLEMELHLWPLCQTIHVVWHILNSQPIPHHWAVFSPSTSFVLVPDTSPLLFPGTPLSSDLASVCSIPLFLDHIWRINFPISSMPFAFRLPTSSHLSRSLLVSLPLSLSPTSLPTSHHKLT